MTGVLKGHGNFWFEPKAAPKSKTKFGIYSHLKILNLKKKKKKDTEISMKRSHWPNLDQLEYHHKQ